MSKRIIIILLTLLSLSPLTYAKDTGHGTSIKGYIDQLTGQLYKGLADGGETFNAIAVLHLEALDKRAKKAEIAPAITEALSHRMTGLPGIVLVERGQIKRVIGEIKRVIKGELSPETGAKAGRLLGASYVVLGGVSTIGGTFQVTTRLVRSETGEIIGAGTVSIPRAEFVAFRRDVVVVKSKRGALFRSMLIPGWGQLYNGDLVKGTSTLAVAIGLAGAATTMGILGDSAGSDYLSNQEGVVGQREVANQRYMTANILCYQRQVIGLSNRNMSELFSLLAQ